MSSVDVFSRAPVASIVATVDQWQEDLAPIGRDTRPVTGG